MLEKQKEINKFSLVPKINKHSSSLASLVEHD